MGKSAVGMWLALGAIGCTGTSAGGKADVFDRDGLGVVFLYDGVLVSEDGAVVDPDSFTGGGPVIIPWSKDVSPPGWEQDASAKDAGPSDGSMDAVMPPTDPGTPPGDPGTPPGDTGTPPVDIAKPPPVDAGSACDKPGACTVESSESQSQGCDKCGTQKRYRSCLGGCVWGGWSDWGGCEGQGPCAPNEVATETAPCNANGCGTKSQTQTCNGSCQWGGWSGYGACVGGLPEAETTPSVTAVFRVDVATMSCSACGWACPPDAGPVDDGVKKYSCLCQAEFDALNYGKTHFMALGTESWRKAVWAKNNIAAVYVDAFIGGYKAGGDATAMGNAEADAIFANAQKNFPSSVPKWFVLNEISAGTWPANATYRDYVVALAKRLKNVHGREVIILSPFDSPGNSWPQWAALAAVAYVGAESYQGTDGKSINASGNSVSYVKGEYQATVDAYVKVGVPKDRLFLMEHYGSTAVTLSDGKACTFGRCGVSKAGWLNAITTRGKAMQGLGIKGVMSYGWAGNAMMDDSATRLEFIGAYAAQNVP